MGDDSATIGTISIGSPVEVNEDVDMVGARGVVTREESLELCDSFIIGGLETSEEGGVDVSSISGISISSGDNTTVNTSGVAGPDFDHSVGDGVAGGHVNYLGVEDEVNALLVFGIVCSDILARDVYFQMSGLDPLFISRDRLENLQ